MAKTKVVIWCGQSNSEGAMAMASLQAGYKQTYSNIKVWNISTQAFESLNYLTNNNQWPVSAQINCFGSEFAFLTGLQSYWGGTIYGITYSVSGTELGTALSATVNWNVNTPGPSGYYTYVIAQINNALVNLWKAGLRDLDFYFIWDQGEQDSKDATDNANYQTNMANFINGVWSQISGNAYSSSRKVFIIPRTNTLIQSSHVTATTITNATNATPIVISATGHGLTTGRQVIIYGVGGNTAANGTWTITNINANSFSLQTSVGNGAYTSGGFINQFVYASGIATAQINACATAGIVNAYSFSTDAYTLQSDTTHFDAQGYEDKGVATVAIITSNNL